MIANRGSIESLETDGRCPSERDLQVYAAVRVDGRRQVDVAAEFGITQGRVSQIVRKVHHWRVGMGVAAELERRDRKSVDRWLDQLRIEKLYEETMELYRRSREPRRKERRGRDHRGEWSSETLDHQPGNLQCLKFAGRLIELRRQLDEDPPPPDQSMDSPRSRIDEYEAFRLLVDMRNDAIRRGDVPEGDHSEFVVRRMIRELVGSGDPAESTASGRSGPPDGSAPTAVDAYREADASRSPEEPTNAAASINFISAAAAGEQHAVVGASDCAEGVCAAEPETRNKSAEANNSEIFSRDVAATRNEIETEWPCDDEPLAALPAGKVWPARPR